MSTVSIENGPAADSVTTPGYEGNFKTSRPKAQRDRSLSQANVATPNANYTPAALEAFLDARGKSEKVITVTATGRAARTEA
jgi:hypothetical protein